ncbi:MAG: hypothetical protein ACYC9K_01155 [Sulfuricaulis sp.]
MSTARPFTETLRELRAGRTQDELAEAMNQVVKAVRETGKVGEVTLTIRVKAASAGNTDTLMLLDTIKTKIPQLERGASSFFATPDNNLTRRDPNQRELPLRVVPETGELMHEEQA